MLTKGWIFCPQRTVSTAWFYYSSAQCPQGYHHTWQCGWRQRLAAIANHVQEYGCVVSKVPSDEEGFSFQMSSKQPNQFSASPQQAGSLWVSLSLHLFGVCLFSFCSGHEFCLRRKEGGRKGGRQTGRQTEVFRILFSLKTLQSICHAVCSCLMSPTSSWSSARPSTWRMDVRTFWWKSKANRFTTWLGQLLSDVFLNTLDMSFIPQPQSFSQSAVFTNLIYF